MFHHSTRGQGLVEYGMLITLVALLVVVLLFLFGEALGNTYSGIISSI
jgi:pilus assembly protein Flp/PilA